VRRRRAEHRRKAVEERAIPRDCAGVQQSEEKLGVVAFQLRKIIYLANVMPDSKSKIPERLQKPSKEFLFGRADRTIEQGEHVDIRMEAELAPAVPTQREY